jgi:hypothetical protein
MNRECYGRGECKLSIWELTTTFPTTSEVPTRIHISMWKPNGNIQMKGPEQAFTSFFKLNLIIGSKFY